MNCKLYILLLTLTLAISPALQAMRVKGFVKTARSLTASQIYAHALARTQYANHNGREHFQDAAHNTYGYNYLPLALAIGLGLTTQHAMEELDIYDMNAVLKVLQNGTEKEKRLITEKIARKISRYKVEDIISMLQHTQQEAHKTLVTAVANNITFFTLEQITQILTNDNQEETHALIADALKKNYNYFTGYSFIGYRLLSSPEYLFEYAQAIQCLQKKYQSDAMQPLAHDLNNNKYSNFALGWNLDHIEKTATERHIPIIMNAIMLNAHIHTTNVVSATFTKIRENISKRSLFYIFSDFSSDRIRSFPLRLFCKVSLKITEKNSEKKI